MARRPTFPGDDRGAILIHVALGVLAMSAFLTIVADFGLMWTSRRQAQNSADAGAIAGATGLGYDDPADYSNSGPAKQNAYIATQTNLVWGQSPYVDISTNITFPLVPADMCDPDGDGLSQCVRAEVFRNTDQLNALPMLFGHLLGLSTQNTKASAVAAVLAANQSECIKPWGVADKWAEGDGSGWDPTDTFNPADGDDYRPQGELNKEDPGTGFRAPPLTPNDYGLELTLKVGDSHDTINPGWFQALDLSSASDSTCTNQGASCYRAAIAGCAGGTWKIGDMVPKENGNMVGPTDQGSQDLIDLDPGADWDPISKTIIGSCTDPLHYTCSQPGLTLSPRVVAIPVFDLELYMATGGPGNGTVKIVNILGFFVDRYSAGTVTGYLINKKGSYNPNGGTIAGPTSFLKQVTLIR
jgi:putative Flp pilus-assembly TadE/G-like protein